MPPPTPVALARLFVTLLAAGLTGCIIVASILQSWAVIGAIFGLQVLTVATFVWLRRPAGTVSTFRTWLSLYAIADVIAIYTQPFSLDRLAYVLAGAFGLVVLGQITRTNREGLTVAIGAAMLVSTLVCMYAAWIGLLRHPGGSDAIMISAVAIGSGVVAARACDLTLPRPRINRQVPRGAFGVVIGAMFAAAGAAYASMALDVAGPGKVAVGGLVIGLVGVLADVAAGYLQAGRRISGQGVAPWPVRHGLGPLMAFGAAAPVAFMLGAYYLVGGI